MRLTFRLTPRGVTHKYRIRSKTPSDCSVKSHRKAGGRRSLRLGLGTILTIVTLASLFFLAFGRAPPQAQSSLDSSTSNIPVLNLWQVLANPDMAQEYHVAGILVVGPGGGLNFTAKLGQTVTIPLSLSYYSFNSSVAKVGVSFKPSPGEESLGSFDISSLESFSPSNLVVGNQTVVVTLSFHLPASVPAESLRVVPEGISVSPALGVYIIDQTNIWVNILS